MFNKGDLVYYVDSFNKRVHHGVFSHYGDTTEWNGGKTRMIQAAWDGRALTSLGWMPEEDVFLTKAIVKEIVYNDDEWE